MQILNTRKSSLGNISGDNFDNFEQISNRFDLRSFALLQSRFAKFKLPCRDYFRVEIISVYTVHMHVCITIRSYIHVIL